MCGRFVSSSTPEELAAYFDAEAPEATLGATYNVAPTNDVYAVVQGPDGVRRVQTFHWGLVPVWAKDLKIGQKMINARSETVAEKPAFKSAFKKYRCIIPMDGFYEWQAAAPGGPLTAKGKPAKQPMFIARLDGELLAVAGLWSTWRDRTAGPDAPWLHSCTILTTSANETMMPIHDRMPVLLAPQDWETWLDPSNQDLEQLGGLLVPAPVGLLGTRPVSTEVNKVANKGPELLDPFVAEPAPAAED